MKRIVTVIILLPLIANAAYTQDKAARLDSLFTMLAAQGRFNGNALVAEKGTVIYSGSFGYSNMEQKKHNDQQTAFQLASLSKVFTAVSVLQLAESSKLKLEDPLAKYFPQFPYSGITIEQLLSHSSGLSDQDLSTAVEDFEKKQGRRHSNADLIPLIAKADVKLKLAPGEKWWYCNLGYELLAALAEKISGLKFEKYLEQNIFRKAGMTHTYLDIKGTHALHAGKAFNYDYPYPYSVKRVRMDLDKPDYMEAAYGHSNIVSTTADLLRFDQALYGNRLLKTRMIEQAFKPATLKNGTQNTVWMNIGGMGKALDGLGWFIFADQRSGKTVWHAGGMQGAVTIMLRNVSKKQTVILLDNTGSEGLYKSALNAMHIINNQPQVMNKRNLSRIYGRGLMEKGPDHAMALLQTSLADTLNFHLGENDMNNLGYAFLSNGLHSKALETLKVNCLLFPLSDNAFNSYAEALAESGQKDEARLMFQKSVALNPGNEESKKALKTFK